MNRKEMISAINTSTNMTLVRSSNTFEKYTKQRFIKDGCDETSLFFIRICNFGREYDGIRFYRKEINSDDELVIELNVGYVRYFGIPGIYVAELGSVSGDSGLIEQLYMTEECRYISLKKIGDTITDTVIADSSDEFISYLLTKEYDYHITVTEATYKKLREAGWYEGRKADISAILKKAEERGTQLTEKQVLFLKEFAGLKSPDTAAANGFFTADGSELYDHFFEYSEDGPILGSSPIIIGFCCSDMITLELSAEGLLLKEGEPTGRTVMEGWQIILN